MNIYPETTQILDEPNLREAKIPLGDKEINLVEVNDNEYKTISKWMEYSEDMRRNWSPDKPLFIIIDMSKVEFSFGRYANRRAGSMMQINPEIPTYIAWVIQKSLVASLMKATLDLVNRTSRKARFILVDSREKGYEWLQETYAKDQATTQK